MSSLILQNKINMATSVNTLLFGLRKLKITKHEDIPAFLKKIIYVVAVLFNIFRILAIKVFYLYIIYFVIKLINGKYDSNMFINCFIFLSLFGSLINSHVTITSKAKYHSIILLNINCKKYVITDIIVNLLVTVVFQIGAFVLMSKIINLTPKMYILLTVFLLLIKLVGEGLNLLYFRLRENTFLNNTILYFIVLIVIFASMFITCKLSLFVNTMFLSITNISLSVCGLISLFSLFKFNSYKKMYKRIVNIKGYSLNDGSTFSKEDIYVINNYDEERSDYKNIYKYFNSLFVKRHRQILMAPTMRLTIILLLGGVILLFLGHDSKDYSNVISYSILHYFMWVFLVIYLFNKTSVMVEAMFYNCDRSLLRYDFYREKKVINQIFKERLKSLIFINLIPVFVLDVFIILCLYLTVKIQIIQLVLLFIMILMVSIFYTVHYITMYYLLQPYDKDVKVKDFRYQIINLFLFIFLFFVSTIKFSIMWLSIIVISFVTLYCVVLITLVLKKSVKTFKIH